MATNVNYKFVAILSSILLVLFMGVAGVAYMVLTKSGEDYLLQGQEFEAAGDWENAASMYERAVGHPEGRTMPEWLRAWQRALENTTPPSRVEYVDVYRQKYRGIIKQLATVERTNLDTQHEYLGSIFEEIILSPYSRENYQFLADETTGALAVFDRQDPGEWETLKRYRGIAQATIIGQGASVPRETVEQAKEDLEAALRADPADAESLLGLVQWYGNQAQRVRGTKPDEARQIFAELVDRVDAFIAENPENALGALIDLRVDLTRRVNGLDPEFPFTDVTTELRDRVEPLADRLDAIFSLYSATGIENLGLTDVGRLEAIELQVDPASRFRRTIELVDTLLASRPNDTDMLYIRATMADRRADLADAERLYESVIDAPIQPLSAAGMRQFSHRLQSTAKLAELSIRQWAAASEADKAAALAESIERRNALAQEVPEDSPLLLLADARIALAEGDVQKAQRILVQYNSLTGDNDPVALFLAARVAMAERSMGRAKTLLTRVVELQPTNVDALLDLARVERSLFEYEAARGHLELVSRLAPDNEELAEQVALLNQATGDAAPDDPIRAAIVAADLLLRGSATEPGNVDAAIASLEQAGEELGYPPAIASSLARLYAETDRSEQALAVLERGLAQTPDNESMLALRRALSSDDTVGELVAMVNESDRSDLEKSLAIWRLYSSNDMLDEAMQTLDRLEELAPTDPRVLGLTFDRALSEEDFDEAQRLADVARDTDADNVGGRIFAGRLATVRGDRDDAIEILQEAVDFDPVNVPARQLLARLLVADGSVAEGIEQYTAAIEMLPNDTRLIVEYIDALRVDNRQQEALEVARASERFARGNLDFRQRWLGLEAVVGNKQFARERREAIAIAEPNNRTNKIALATVLLDLGQREQAKAMIDTLRAEEDTLGLAQLAARWHADARDMTAARNTFVEYIVGRDRSTMTSAPYIAMGRFLVNRGEQSSGVAALEQAREYQDPERREADKVLGDTLMGLTRYADAIAAYRSVIEAGADDDDGLYRQRMVECLIRVGEYDQAAAALELLPAATREQLTVVLLEADLLRARGDNAASLEVLNTAAAEFPTEPLVYMKRAQILGVDVATQDDAMTDLDEALRIEPRNWQALRLRAALHAEMDNADAAIEDLKAAVSANPSLEELRFGLITELVNRGRNSEAEQIASASIDVRPSDLDLIVTSGDIFARGEDWDRAARIYERAWRQAKIVPIGRRYVESLLSQSPPDARTAQAAIQEMGDAIETEPTIRMARALAYQIQRREDQARRDADATFDMIVTQPNAFTFWLDSLERMYGSTDAVADYLDDFERRAVNVPNTASWLTVLRGRVLIDDDKTRSEGERLLTNAVASLDVSPQQNSAYRTLGGSYYSTGRYTEAVDAWQAAIDLYPNDAEFANNIAFTLTKHLDRAADALPLAERAVELAPERPNVLDTLGITLLSLDRAEEADAVLTRALPLARQGSTRLEILLHSAQAKLALGNVEAARNLAGQATEASSGASDLPAGFSDELDALKREIDSRG